MTSVYDYTSDIGWVLYRGPSEIGDGSDIVAILTLGSSNPKTGNMAQVYILQTDETPLSAVQNNRNSGSCGTCPLQGRGITLPNGQPKIEGRGCYVNRGQGSLSVYLAWQRGRYATYVPRKHNRLLRRRRIRWGADGDPAAIPTSIVQRVSRASAGCNAYTHAWETMHGARRRAWQRLAMASCHNAEMRVRAQSLGWRTFTVVPIGREDLTPADDLQCPAYTHSIQCADCGLCAGLSRPARSIWIEAHAKTGANVALYQLG